MPGPIGPPEPYLGGGNPVYFGRGDAVRVDHAVKLIERAARNPVDPQNRFPTGREHWVIKVKTTATIAVATSEAQPTAGNATVQKWSGSQWVSAGFDVSVYNPDPNATIAANKLITCTWVSGMWEANLEVCPP